MRRTLHLALSAFARDRQRGLSRRQLTGKGARYALSLAMARFYLRAVDHVEEGVRTIGQPRIDNAGHMSIGSGCVLRSVNVPVELATGPQGTLRIGRRTSMNYGVSIGCLARVELGARCRLGPYVMIVDTEFHDLYDRTVCPPAKPVLIASDVWIGAKASVLPGVSIGRGAVVGTGAVVTADVAPFTVVAGVPARVVRTLNPSLFVSTAEDVSFRGEHHEVAGDHA